MKQKMLFVLAIAGFLQVATVRGQKETAQRADSRTAEKDRNPALLFAEGQAALQRGELDAAERAFRKVVELDPRSGAAYSNLGVIAMRRAEWKRALALLRKAEKLSPRVAGIRLNIGLAEYRRGNYAGAVAPFESVVREQPDSQQARYLLGLCRLFAERYADAAAALEPLWPKMSGDFMYLYALDIAANRAGQKDLDEKALARLVEVGAGTPEYHLILGKAYLNREEPDRAAGELESALRGRADLPFAHLYLGKAYSQMGQNPRAEEEFKSATAGEPDLADGYEELGMLYNKEQRREDAERAFLEAVKRDAKRVGALFGLARIYYDTGKYAEALSAIDKTVRLAPASSNAHVLRAQILTKLGRGEESKGEFAEGKRLMAAGLARDRDLMEKRKPDPELLREKE